MTTTTENISPADARLYLENNEGNRSINDARVDSYAQMMTAGLWLLNGESIKFCNGKLVDGQHRLLAIIKSGVTIQTQVVRGLPENALITIDSGQPRDVGDVFHFLKIDHADTMAQAIRLIFKIESGFSGSSKSSAPSVCLEFFKSNERRLLRSYEHVGIVKRGILGRESLIAWHFTFSKSSDTADEFITALITGENLSRENPIFLMRKILLEDVRSLRRMKLVVRWALLVKCWNAWLKKEQVPFLRWSPRVEKFPEVL